MREFMDVFDEVVAATEGFGRISRKIVLCKDCKHIDNRYPEDLDRGSKMAGFSCYCTATISDFVMGKYPFQADRQLLCSTMRHSGPCGPEGYFWEKKDA